MKANPTTHKALASAENAEEIPERYASLLSTAHTMSAKQMVLRLYQEIEHHRKSAGTRTRKRHAKSSAKFFDAVERFVGRNAEPVL